MICGDGNLRDIWKSSRLHRDARGDIPGDEQTVEGRWTWNDKREMECCDSSMSDVSDKVPRTSQRSNGASLLRLS